MDNYYETCLNNVQTLIKDNQISQALAILDVELSMPYVPQPYLTTFQTIRDSLRIDRKPTQMYFEMMEDIEQGLLGNDNLKHKSLISLERMNLRSEMDALKRIFLNAALDDWIKKQILFYLMEQNIPGKIEIMLSNEIMSIDLATLENPIGSDVYLDCVAALQAMLESDNPSLLMLCIAELDQMVLEKFPNHFETLDAQAVLDTVNRYMTNV